MKDFFSLIILLRLFYSSILVFVALILMREVWLLWLDRQMTFGEIKYFEGIKVEQGAADRFRHLLKQEYDQIIDHIQNYGHILETLNGFTSEKPNLLQLKASLSPAVLASARNFESFDLKGRDFASLDISFQGLDIKKLFSSVRTYLSPSVDLNIVVTRNSAENIRANIKWPREGRPLKGHVGRFVDFEIGPLKEDAALARKVSCYLLWLQAFNGRTKDMVPLLEFCLWIDGLTTMRALADAKSNLVVNSPPDTAAVLDIAQRFLPGFKVEFDYVDNYQVATILLSETKELDAEFKPHVSLGNRKVPIDPEFLASLLNYFYVQLTGNPERRQFFRNAIAELGGGPSGELDLQAIGRNLLAERVVPWSKIAKRLTSEPANPDEAAKLESIIDTPSERFESADIGLFGFPGREVSSILRDIGPDGRWRGTAFLVAPDVALSSSFARSQAAVGGNQNHGFVEYVQTPYHSSGVAFHRVAVKEVVQLMPSKPVGVVALKLAAPIANVKPFRIASRTRDQRRSGRPIHLLTYLARPTGNTLPLDSVFNEEFERPVYLGGTILLQNDTGTEIQYAYDAFTLPGAGGSPVVDALSGEVIAMHHSGLRYSNGIIKIAVGLDITNLSENAAFKALVSQRGHARTSPDRKFPHQAKSQ